MNKALNCVLKPNQILTASSEVQTYGRDWTRTYKVNASAVVFPESTADIQKLVLWARENKQALVPSGGRTGLSGGAVASRGEIVVSLERMNKILELNAIDEIVRCQAGVITENLQNYAREAGFYFPVDFASRGSSQIGGNIATNAGGVKVIRYGQMRDWVMDLEVVTGAGEILQLNRGLIKNNSGYDLRQLFIGSEGTLGFITEASLGLTQVPRDLGVLLLTSSKLSFATEILKRFRKFLTLTAFEFFTQNALTHVLEGNTELSPPFSNSAPFYFLIEFENGSEASIDLALKAFDDCVSDGLALEGALSQNAQQAATFWKYRENISEALSKHFPYKSDIAVRISKIPEFVWEADLLLSTEMPGYEIVWFGHIGDGNLHINLLRPSTTGDDQFTKDCEKMSHLLFSLLKKFGGSISAEHGIGLTKKPYLEFSRSPAEIKLMKQIKRVFDPDGILNPGKIFDITDPPSNKEFAF